MNPESPKQEKIEDGVDLYDGMIFEYVSNDESFNKLDAITLNKLKERLEEYYEIMNDADYTKGEKLTERLGVFINKYKLKEALDHVNLLLIKENKESDDLDNEIISYLDDYQLLEFVDYGKLIELRMRLALYLDILDNGSENDKEALSVKMGHYLARDSVMDLFGFVDGLIGVFELGGE